LRRTLFGEGDLQRMEGLGTREAFDGRHLRIPNERGERQAREDRHAVDENGAGATFAELASVLRAGETELLAKDLEERVVGIRHAASAPIR